MINYSSLIIINDTAAKGNQPSEDQKSATTLCSDSGGVSRRRIDSGSRIRETFTHKSQRTTLTYTSNSLENEKHLLELGRPTSSWITQRLPQPLIKFLKTITMSYSNPYADPPRPYPHYNDSSTSLPTADYPLHPTAHNNHNHGPASAYPYAMTPDDQSVDQYDMGHAGHLHGKSGRDDGGNPDEEEKAPLTAQYSAYPPGTPGS